MKSDIARTDPLICLFFLWSLLEGFLLVVNLGEIYGL